MTFEDLPDFLLCQCLRIQLSLKSLSQLAPVSKRISASSIDESSWEQLDISIPRGLLAHQKFEKLCNLATSSWMRCNCLRLGASPSREAAISALRKAGFTRALEVEGNGPVPLFCMGHYPDVTLEGRLELHFFEPRYRWMCHQLLDDAEDGQLPSCINEDTRNRRCFGFVTEPTRGGFGSGAKGYIMEIQDYHWNMDGTCDVSLQAQSSFSVLESWEESVPKQPWASALYVAYIIEGSSTSQQPAQASAAPSTPPRELLAPLLGSATNRLWSLSHLLLQVAFHRRWCPSRCPRRTSGATR
mmetsp:Transcript_95123/g.174286  ORF Transcript_95123/g.174286 Transcript_95123/m.174286 type:complete len:300 (+) Transcript_95123:89-988(+)